MAFRVIDLDTYRHLFASEKAKNIFADALVHELSDSGRGVVIRRTTVSDVVIPRPERERAADLDDIANRLVDIVLDSIESDLAARESASAD
jgi:hypothetical protein